MTPGWNGSPSAFPLGFTPHRYQRRMPRRELVSRTLTRDYTFDINRTSIGKSTHILRPRVALPSLPRGRRCSPRPDAVPGRRLPLPSGQSLHPAAASHQRGHSSRGINEGSRDSPVRSAPGLWPPGWDGRPSGFPLCSAPRRYRQRTTGRGRAVSTRPELRDRHNRPSYPRVPSRGATSCRNGMRV